MQNLVMARTRAIALLVWNLAGELPLLLSVTGHKASTVPVGLNTLRLLCDAARRRAMTSA
ncbi:hypothetical protein [Embleya sp. NBC_00888]|uniref:hypothetical protein n=1 Tax=Embleya sp. NBC_00888 TaxID=2975960 RepID=UPI003866AEB4